jgi:hypothetical protein
MGTSHFASALPELKTEENLYIPKSWEIYFLQNIYLNTSIVDV